ncbi:hypothetical protein SISNIDRAFT_419053 [Sistotremastrum niveocremeum HHB9708]|uniref:t-SNARE coiled-coil homology domain-containing protein n=1 Tax=Sistotremastrum niveocremeum HHB9708 TaxID=1314777 RepID=A0A164NNN2_9AGAM|nr:hypothetical protein SISNIDRAFT_419053 [Sistotremastrum niveocremeum HHB9708]
MSTSRGGQTGSTEDTYELQNDTRLDDLHAKIRTLRGVTNDIYDDAERQNLMLDEGSNTFSNFTHSLSTTTTRFARAFGLSSATGGGTRQTRIILYVVLGIIGLWIGWKALGWFWWSSATGGGSVEDVMS